MFTMASNSIHLKFTLLKPSSVCEKHSLLTVLKVIVLLFLSTSFYLLWSQYSVVFNEYVNFDTMKYFNNRPLKYILVWTRNGYDVDYFQNGQVVFMRHNCTFQNCYITSNRNYFKDITKFDALVFNLRGLNTTLPRKRAVLQKYIFFSLESANMFPVCSPIFDEYFNWTATYRIDSDIFLPYFIIKDVNGTVIGPKKGIKWIKHMQDINEDFARKLRNKTKVGAWFVSRCLTKNFRECFVHELRRYLGMKNRTLDVYGKCGILKCYRNKHSDCGKMLQDDYHFYMSLENSFDKDYVTEKLLTAVQNSVVPVVYGGANYSWFLPPESYLDARAYSPGRMAQRMLQMIRFRKLYQKYFRWTRYYSYHDAISVNVCSICRSLNNKTKMQTYSLRKDFRRWWNQPQSVERCKDRDRSIDS